eukprot:331360_1
MSNSKVKEKVTKTAAKAKKKFQKLVGNKRRGYSKLTVKHDVRGAFSSQNDYDDEELEMEVDLNYDMNASYNYVNDPNNTFNPCELSTINDNGTSTINNNNKTVIESTNIINNNTTSVTQTYIDDINARGISTKTEYCVVPFYLLVCILSILTTALLCISEISLNLGFSILITFGFIGAAAGMYGVYLWGIFDDVLQYLILQNELYSDNIDRLNNCGQVLQNDIDDITGSINYLKRDGNTLENTMNTYNILKEQLNDIIAEHGKKHNETLQELIDDFNKQCDSMNTIVNDNEKAHLLSIFYSVKLYDYGMKNCLNKKQYKKFLSYCCKKTREKFKNYGGFQAMDIHNTGYIDVDQFEQVVFKVLDITVNQTKDDLHSSIKIQQRL